MDKFNPPHYMVNGVQAIDIAEWLSYNKGSALKYIVRAGLKPDEPEVDDLNKAIWFLKREIKRLGGEIAP